jgi:D-alanyl-D-alanine carboxypeptidase
MKLCLAILLLTVQVCQLHSQHSNATNSASQQIDEYIKVQMRRNYIPGLSLAVVKDGKMLKVNAYGLSNIETNGDATPETIYKIGSLSKQFLAAGVMLLVQEGQIGLDDKISNLFDSIPETWKGISIRNLLTHTSGIIGNAPNFDPLKLQSDSDAVKSAFTVPLHFAPGSKWEYSNMNYYFLAEIIRKLSGKSWSQFINERIFDPTGMTQTRTTSVTDIVPHRADGYTTEATGLRKADIWITVRPSGAFLSSVIDLARWDAALYSDSILKKVSKEQMWSPVKLNDGTTYPYGFGWFVDTIQSHRRVHHGGAQPGFKADLERYVDDELTIIVLANNGSAETEKIARHIAGYYIPAFAPPLEEAIADTNPRITARIKEMIDGFKKGNLDRNMFTSNVASEIEKARSYFSQTFSSSGKIQTFSLVERNLTGTYPHYRYRLDYRYDSFFVICEFDKNGKINGIGISE